MKLFLYGRGYDAHHRQIQAAENLSIDGKDESTQKPSTQKPSVLFNMKKQKWKLTVCIDTYPLHVLVILMPLKLLKATQFP